MLMIRCPSTGKLLSTGIAMDVATLKTASVTDNSVKCPHCGQLHTWSKNDVVSPDDAKPN